MALYTHPDMLGHDPGGHPVRGGHPESPARLAAVLAALEHEPLDRREAPLASPDDLRLVHPDAYLEQIEAAGSSGRHVQLDPDSAMDSGSLQAALRAAGAAAEAVRAVRRGEVRRAFCAVRPPGHHAEPAQAMGFCIYSNVAVAARVALELGYARVGIVDFDVHHGNGTQAAFETEPRVFFGSIHQDPLYPGTGRADERGVGNVVNVLSPPGASREHWRRAYQDRLVAALDAFAPELILVSAGFDAHAADPLAEQRLLEEDFAWATRALLEVARARCGGELVSSLEGGYDLGALGRSALAHVQALREG